MITVTAEAFTPHVGMSIMICILKEHILSTCSGVSYIVLDIVIYRMIGPALK